MNYNKTNELDIFNPTEEHLMLRNSVCNFVKSKVEPQANDFNEKEKFNLNLMQEFGELGMLGLTADVKYGGSGMGAMAVAIVHEELSYSDPAFALSYLGHTILCVHNISNNANTEQKEKFLPNLCSGKWIGAMAMSEVTAGTDVLGMKTFAEKDGDFYILNGRKMWITNGIKDNKKTPCDCVVVYAKTAKNRAKESVSTFIVTSDIKGFFVGQKISSKLGMRASNTAELCFDNCRVPKFNLIGEEGESFIHMMKNLEIERLGLAAIGIGIAKRCLETMVNYAKERKAFDRPIVNFGQIQSHIAQSFAKYKAAKTYLYQVAQRVNLKNGKNRIDTDGVKLVCAQVAKEIADRAIQVLGGNGYIGEYVVERLWRDAKLLEIGGGTIEAHEKNISSDLKSINIAQLL